ncbi:hypothetical protein B4071_2033 [Bacillus subtilis]|nr:hypothetical protein B4071_2033 [Bacillus subtilis]
MADEFKWLHRNNFIFFNGTSKYGPYSDNIPIYYSAWKLTSRGLRALKDRT